MNKMYPCFEPAFTVLVGYPTRKQICNPETRGREIRNSFLTLPLDEGPPPSIPSEQETGWVPELVWMLWKSEKSLAHARN